MPGSYPTFKREVARHIKEVCGDALRIVDVGVGAGVWADLLGHGRLDAVEIWQPYIERFGLRAKYRDVILDDLQQVNLPNWDYVILGDVIEHLDVDTACRLVRRLTGAGCKALIAVPYRCEQDAVGGNPYERHLQADLTPELMAERYPELRLLIGDDTYGYYVNYDTPRLAPDPPRIPVVWFFGDRGYWDHGLLIHAMDGTLWPTPRPFLYEHHERQEKIGAAGCLGIFAGRWHLDYGPQLAEFVAARSWSLIVNVSDEECVGPWHHALADNSLVWVQTPHQAMCGDPPRVRRLIPLGWRTDTRQTAMTPPLPMPLTQRRHLWSFAGQGDNHPVRQACMEVLRAMGDGPLLITDTFGAGMPYREYLEQLAETSIVPCPSGPSTPDTFRVWEALEMGCLPVADAESFTQSFTPDYFAYLFQCAPEQIPFPRLTSWSEFPAIIQRYRHDPAALRRDMTRASAWWQGRKRQFVLDLEDDIRAVSGLTPPIVHSGLRHQVTVLIPTSPVSSHPSTAMIEDTIARIRAYPDLAECEILLMVDGVRPEQEHYRDAYEEYTRRLVWLCNWDARFRGCLPLLFDAHTHQAGMTRRALERVRTPLILFVEHDTWPMGKIDWSGMARALAEPGVNSIRLHIFDRVLDEHRELYGRERQDIAGVQLISTRQWSQRPHLARADWYREIIRDYFGLGDRAMIEDRVIGYAANEQWGLWIYAPPGSVLRSGTCDGRGDDPKWTDDRPLHSAIDGLHAKATRARDQTCDAGHASHTAVDVRVVLSGQSAVREYPPIPERLARSFDLTVFDAPRYMGFKGYCTGQDEMSLSILTNGIWEGFETRLVMEILEREKPLAGLVLDFGAHIGWYTLLAASFGYIVEAFEADVENLTVLRANLRRNRLDGYYEASLGWISEHTTPLVVMPRITLLKSDLEGSEDQVERMCHHLFEAHRIRFALLEISPCFKPHYPDTVMRIAEAGYWVYDVPSKLCDDAEGFSRDPLAYLRSRRIPHEELRRYVEGVTQSNFLFALPEAMG